MIHRTLCRAAVEVDGTGIPSRTGRRGLRLFVRAVGWSLASTRAGFGSSTR